MLKAEEIAKYFLYKDLSKTVFNKNYQSIRGINCYEGSVRLNKYLHISQLLYFTRYGKKLFSDDLLAYHNGAVVRDVLNNYSLWYFKREPANIDNPSVREFLDKIYEAFKNASIEDLIEISHEDPAWQENREKIYSNAKLNLNKHRKEYKKQYADIIKVLDL